MNGLNWTDEQRALVEAVIGPEVENTRLAHKIIPDFQLPPRARAVSADTFDYGANTVDDQTQLDVHESSEDFLLSRLQVEDDDLSRAILAVRRAIQRLSRTHDQA